MKTVKIKKTVKLKNTVESKIESKKPTDDTLMMNNNNEQHYSIPETIDRYEKEKKFQKDYLRLKTSLESHREAKPNTTLSVKDYKTVSYYERIESQIQANIASDKERAENKMNGLKEKLKLFQQEIESRLEQIQNDLKAMLHKHESSLTTVQGHLKDARVRMELGSKTKLEIQLEKQIQQLITDFKAMNPDKDMEYYCPGYKTLLNRPSQSYQPSQPSQQSVISTEPPSPEPEPEVERNTDTELERLTKEMEEFRKMTPWQRYVKANPTLSIYKLYHQALADGITPDIEEPDKPVVKSKPKVGTETVSRQSLAKILPQYA